MNTSQLRPMSVGIVAENKPLDSKDIQVIPIELFNLMNGELHSDTITLKSSGLNEDDTVYKAEVKMGATLTAVWLGETNRLTAPDVRRGEQVMIYQSGDADKYYWSSLGRDDDLRRLETAIYRFSGLPNNPDEEISSDNSYSFEISTHQKIITVKTSNRNGEYCVYKMQFNPGTGQWTMEDDKGNFIQIDSEKTTIHASNADGTLIELNKEKIHLSASSSISLTTKQFHLNAKSLLLECDLVEIKGKQTRIHGTLQVDGIHTNMLQCNLPILAPGILGPPFIPGPPVMPVTGTAPPVSYPF